MGIVKGVINSVKNIGSNVGGGSGGKKKKGKFKKHTPRLGRHSPNGGKLR